MDDERWESGMPVLDRQAAAGAAPAQGAVRAGPTRALPPSLQGLPARSVPEVAPTPLQKHYVLLSVPVLILGAIAITALELGAPLGSPLIKLCVLVAAPLLVVTTADAVVRIWRSAWAWMPVDRTKGMFRLAWVATSLVGLTGLIAAAIVAVLACWTTASSSADGSPTPASSSTHSAAGPTAARPGSRPAAASRRGWRRCSTTAPAAARS
jgi:hypothetical protein